MSDKCLLATDFFFFFLLFFYHFYSQFNETTLDSSLTRQHTYIYIKNRISLILNLCRWQINSSLNCEENKQTEELKAALVILGDGGETWQHIKILVSCYFCTTDIHTILYQWEVFFFFVSLLWWYLDIHSYTVIEK